MAYQDLREWLEQVDALGELRRVEGAHWDLEIGTITELVRRENPHPPALLFEDLPDYPQGFRLLTGINNTARRLALTLHLIRITRNRRAGRSQVSAPIQFVP